MIFQVSLLVFHIIALHFSHHSAGHIFYCRIHLCSVKNQDFSKLGPFLVEFFDILDQTFDTTYCLDVLE
jgi:hypothetical protein